MSQAKRKESLSTAHSSLGSDTISSAIHFVPRIPRYELIASDDGAVRLAEGRFDDGPIIGGYMVNISATGALVAIDKSTARMRFLDEGEMIKVELSIPDRGRFAFFATVVRLDPSDERESTWDLGLAFRNLPKALSELLDRNVTTRSRDFSHPYNFALATSRGFRHAAYKAIPNQVMTFFQSTATQPLWWLALFSFTTVTILPLLIAKIAQLLE